MIARIAEILGRVGLERAEFVGHHGSRSRLFYYRPAMCTKLCRLSQHPARLSANSAATALGTENGTNGSTTVRMLADRINAMTMGDGIVWGLILGAVVGVALGDIEIWIGIGIALGIALAAHAERAPKGTGEQ